MMLRPFVLLLTTVMVLLLGAVHGHERVVELEERIDAIEEETLTLKEEIETRTGDSDCAGPTERATWEGFFEELDRHNGDQTL